MPGYQFSFPRDHGSHTDFRLEWWYFTGNLQTPAGRPFGYELTFFRTRLLPPGNATAAASPLAADELFLAHFAISDIERREHESWERIGRKGFDQGSASTTTLDVRMGDWKAMIIPDASSTQTMRLMASANDGETTRAALELVLRPLKGLVIHGENGVHQKAGLPGQASHYISFTRLDTSGTLHLDGEAYPVTGLSWMDHEFASNQLGEDEVGWDWFALQLDGGEDLMLYQLRRADGSYNTQSSGTLIEKDGQRRMLPGQAYRIEATGSWPSPDTDAQYPMGWKIEVPAEDGNLTVTPAFEEQEMLVGRTTGASYWEGSVRIEGRWRGQEVRGRGYVELVGYAGRFTGL